MTAQLACDALQMALWRRKRPRNVIVHTDRGGQYCSADYQAQLKRHNLRGSMSAKGCCYDNACVESFFHSLKVECIHGEHFISREIMRQRCLIISNVITIGGGGTVGVAASVRNNLKTRTSLRPVSILQGRIKGLNAFTTSLLQPWISPRINNLSLTPWDEVSSQALSLLLTQQSAQFTIRRNGVPRLINVSVGELTGMNGLRHERTLIKSHWPCGSTTPRLVQTR